MVKIFTQEKHKNFIPIIALSTGIIVCILCYIFAKELLPENTTFLESLLKGILCGLSSTGLHQLLTHLYKHIQSKKIKPQKNKDKVIELKPFNSALSNKDDNINNLNNYTNTKCVNCPYTNCEEPEYVKQKTLE